MSDESDNSDSVISGSDEEGDDNGDLSNLGEASATIAFRTVAEKPFQRVEEGYNRMAQQILENCPVSNQELVPTSGEQRTLDSCDGTRRCGKAVLQQHFIQVQQHFGDVKVQGTRNLTIGGTQNINTPGPVQENKGQRWSNWIFVITAVVTVTSVITAILLQGTPMCYDWGSRSDDTHWETFPKFEVERGNTVGYEHQYQKAVVSGDIQSRRAQRIMDWTVSRIQTWIEGMVKTSALEKVMAKLRNGITWITIKGSPGEGKTTVAYMALDQLHRMGRQVFQLTSPEEFTEVNTSFTQPVILLDDILGDLEFDQAAWQRWKPVLHKIFDIKEHTSYEHTNIINPMNEPTILLVGRDYVLNSASAQMGRLFNFLMHEFHVVDMSHRTEREREEKQSLWNAIVVSKGIVLDQHKIDRVFYLRGNHGFPHVCRLFVIMHQTNPAIDVEEFFKTPLSFLSNTIESFLENDHKLSLFKEMIIRQGKVSQRELERKDNGYKVIKSAMDLVGTYLKLEEGIFEFEHPSVYDSVAFNLCKYHPLFVIENCKLSFLHERLRLIPSHNTVREPQINENEFVVSVSKPYVKDLAKRFATEISNSNLALVLSHQACTDEMFITQMMSELTLPLVEILQITDRNSREHFLSLLSSSKSPELLKYLDNNLSHQILRKALYLIWHGVYKYAASSVLTYLMETNRAFNINTRFGYDKKTSLMIAAETKDSQFVHQVMSLKPDLNARDIRGKTALHYLCLHGHVSAVKEVIDRGVDINTKDIDGKSALFYACSSSYHQTGLVRLLLDNGAEINRAAVRSACETGNMDVLKMIFEKEVPVNMALSFRDTPLHVASFSGHVKVMEYLLEHGASVDSLDFMERTPLHSAVIRCGGSVDVLLRAGANVQGTSGYTPLHEATRFGYTECIHVLLKARAEINLCDKNGCTPLHEAANRGSKEAVDMLIKAGANVHVQDKDGYTPLHKAAVTGIEECVEVLLIAGADANMWSKNGYAPLHAAVDSGCEGCIKTLVRHRADINLQSEVGQTPLHQATKKRCKNCIDILVKGGADVTVQDGYGYVPLHEAAESGCKECISILVNAGADVNVRNEYGTTPLHKAAGKGCKECINMLVSAGADVNAQDKGGFSPLHSVSRSECKGCVYVLLEAGSEVNAQSKLGTTPLHLAAVQGNKQCIQILLMNGADANAQCNSGYTPLHTAAEWGHKECVDALIQGGAYVKVQTKDGYTPIHTAAELGPKDLTKEPNEFSYKILLKQAEVKSKGCIDVLLKEGADVNVTDTIGDTPLHKAAEWGCRGCIEPLLKAGADVTLRGKGGYTPLHKAANCGCKECIDMMLKAGSKVNVENQRGHTPLHKAAEKGSEECVHVLLKAGAHVNIQTEEGCTALHKAANSGFAKCIVLLLNAGADVNIQDDDYILALHSAARFGSEESVQILLKSGSYVNVESKYGLTPLHEAAAGSCQECVEVLLMAGADVNAQCNDGYTALHIAAKWKCKGCMSVLLKVGADVNAQSKAGHSPLHNAARIGPQGCYKMMSKICFTTLHKESMRQSEYSIDVLLRAGARVNVKDKNGYTPLHNAAELGCRDCLKLLLNAGSYVNEQTIDGYTPLHMAADIGSNECANVPNEVICYTIHQETAMKRSEESIDVLLKADAHVNVQDDSGATPLHRAVEVECKQCVDMLMKAGADVNIENIDGETPFS